MKRKVLAISAILIFCFAFTLTSAAQQYEFSYGEESTPEDKFSEYRENLPEEVKNDLREDVSEYDTAYFTRMLKKSFSDGIKSVLPTSLGLLSVIVATAFLTKVSDTLINSKNQKIFSLCMSLCTALLLWQSFKGVTEVAEMFLKSITNVMMMIVPVMEAVLISTGNTGGAAVTSAGLDLMITVGENLFSKVLFPASVICFFLAVASSVSENGGIAFMSKALRGLVTGGLILIMALMSFVLMLQSGVSSAADNFTVRTVKFAISSYLPIVGGTVSESFSCLAAGMAVLKATCGVTGVVVILLVTIPPFVILAAQRLSLFLCEALAGSLNCEKVKNLIGEAGGVCNLLIAVCAGGAVMFIIAVGIFLRTVPAMN